MTNTEREIDDLMQDVRAVSMSVRLKLNEIKTKYPVENIKKPGKTIIVGGKPLELVEDFL